MGKIFKYEWKKQMFSKVVIGCILLGLTGWYMIGTAADKQHWQEAALVFLVFAGMFSALYVGIESLLVLNRDLRTKESHMLFMVPHSAYAILGAKILAAVCQILLTAALFAGAFALCFVAYLAANDGFAQFMRILQRFIRDWTEMELGWQQILLALSALLVSWISTISIGFLAIISVRTIFVKSKLATPIAVVLFFVLSWGMGQISQKIMGLATSVETGVMYFGINLGVTAVISIVLLILSGWMAEKKLSV